jgi:hypothetical protein
MATIPTASNGPNNKLTKIGMTLIQFSLIKAYTEIKALAIKST